ncbi:hypothetical protein BG011_009683 [Mortierella polycephala]|uniref:N-acetyltransferase domain-containing protein n=1 Tax=Mortierella polycephala TaxID=41804 RepID=A0A9P6PNW8_9FUNG|nr:hypothetical protein BG011_009683 [Mortierella polycephala]
MIVVDQHFKFWGMQYPIGLHMAAPSVIIRLAHPEKDTGHINDIYRIINTAYRTDAGWTHEEHLIADDRISLEGVKEALEDTLCPLVLAFDQASGKVIGTLQLDPAERSPGLGFYTVNKEEEERIQENGTKKNRGENLSTPSPYKESLPKEQQIFVGLFSVDPTQQSRGIGRKLFEYGLDYAKETLGRRQAVVTVLFQRTELLDMYQRFGFVDYGEKLAYPEPNFVLQEDVHFSVLRRAL